MATLKDLCSSISGQVESFFHQIEIRHYSLLKPLSAENAFLRAELAMLAPTSHFGGSHVGMDKLALAQSDDRGLFAGSFSAFNLHSATLPGTPRTTPRRKAARSQPMTPTTQGIQVFTPRYPSEGSADKSLGVTHRGCLTTPRLRTPPRVDITKHAEDMKDWDELSDRTEEAQPIRRVSSLSASWSLETMPDVLKVAMDGLSRPLRNWFRFVAPLCDRSVISLRKSAYETSLLLRPAWEAHALPMTERPSSHSWLARLHAGTGCPTSSLLDLESMFSESIRSRFVLHPDNKFVNVWSVLGATMILYDVLTFPLAGFDYNESAFQEWLIWLSAIFWTLDIAVTCFRGVHHKGVVEMRHYRILLLYARTWFVLDFSLVSIDWFLIYLTKNTDANVAGAGKVLRSGKAVRAARVVRAVRLIRTIKVVQLCREFFENLKSDYLQLFVKLGLSIIVIVLLNHYITCAWYAQAYFNSGQTWITVFLGVDPRPSFATEYFTTLHFALTQIAGSQDIVPQNGRERFVASLIIVFDIIVLSVLVGTVSDIFAQFRSLTLERSKELALIRKFCHRTQMRQSIEHRIWLFFRRHYRREQRYVLESDIEFLRYLPSSLKMDLHEHLYLSVLVHHPLFQCLLEHDRFSLLAVCSAAISTIAPPTDTEVFYEGDKAKYMFLVKTGALQYRVKRIRLEAMVRESMWISEVALWTKWMHCGRLIAERQCELITVQADMFEKTMLDRAETSDYFRCLRKYAALFAQRMSDSYGTSSVITDLDLDTNFEGLQVGDRVMVGKESRQSKTAVVVDFGAKADVVQVNMDEEDKKGRLRSFKTSDLEIIRDNRKEIEDLVNRAFGVKKAEVDETDKDNGHKPWFGEGFTEVFNFLHLSNLLGKHGLSRSGSMASSKEEANVKS